MFLRRARGLLDFLVASLCLWAAAYHTPMGAGLRHLSGWLLGVSTSARPLLAYYSGGVYGAQDLNALGPPIGSPIIAATADLSFEEALGRGTYVTWSRLQGRRRQVGLDLARRYGVSADKLERDETGPAEMARLLRAAAVDLKSDEAAVLALFMGYEPARYAAHRARAEGLEATLEAMVRQLPGGYSDEVGEASTAMMLGTAYALSWPVSPTAKVTSPFGYRIHPTLGIRKLHTGVDLGVPVGTEVRAVFDGIVRRASYDGVNGNVLVVDHGRGVTTAYCHNSELLASVGQRVRKGQPIARSGNTGRSTGPHLHYQLELGHEPYDPFRFRARTDRLAELKPFAQGAPKAKPARAMKLASELAEAPRPAVGVVEGRADGDAQSQVPQDATEW